LISNDFSAGPVNKHQRSVQVFTPKISAIPVTDLFNILKTGCRFFRGEIIVLYFSLAADKKNHDKKINPLFHFSGLWPKNN
jgi:hypothetical protein